MSDEGTAFARCEQCQREFVGPPPTAWRQAADCLRSHASEGAKHSERLALLRRFAEDDCSYCAALLRRIEGEPPPLTPPRT